MIIWHVWIQIAYIYTPYEADLKKGLVCGKKEKIIAVNSQIVMLFFLQVIKSQKLFTEHLHERQPIQNISSCAWHIVVTSLRMT